MKNIIDNLEKILNKATKMQDYYDKYNSIVRDSAKQEILREIFIMGIRDIDKTILEELLINNLDRREKIIIGNNLLK